MGEGPQRRSFSDSRELSVVGVKGMVPPVQKRAYTHVHICLLHVLPAQWRHQHASHML